MIGQCKGGEIYVIALCWVLFKEYENYLVRLEIW